MLDINFSDNQVNSFELILLQSEEYADEIIRRFKISYTGGDPTVTLNNITNDMNLLEGDLLIESKKRIEAEISNYLERLF